MKRIVFVGGAALLLVVMGAGSASADAKFDKASVPSDTDQNLVLNASVQSLVGYNKKVVLTVPDGFSPLSCSAPQGFKCSKSTATNPTRSLITWENTSPAPAEFGITPTTQFPFKLHTISDSGDYKFNVDQTYSDGSSDHWTGDQGTVNPAPVLKVTGIGTPAVTNTTIDASTDDTSPTTEPSFDVPSYDPNTYTTVPFTDDTTATTPAAADTTPTTVDGTTDTTFGSVAISKSGGGGPGIEGTEKIVLLALAVLAVGAAAFGSWRHRAA